MQRSFSDTIFCLPSSKCAQSTYEIRIAQKRYYSDDDDKLKLFLSGSVPYKDKKITRIQFSINDSLLLRDVELLSISSDAKECRFSLKTEAPDEDQTYVCIHFILIDDLGEEKKQHIEVELPSRCSMTEKPRELIDTVKRDSAIRKQQKKNILHFEDRPLVDQFIESANSSDIQKYLSSNRLHANIKNNIRSTFGACISMPYEPITVTREEKRVAILISGVRSLSEENESLYFYRTLAFCLHEAGHSVAIYFASSGDHYETEIDFWKQYYKNKGIEFYTIQKNHIMLEGMQAVHMSYEIYQILKKNVFDIIHFDLEGGLGFYSINAKHAGLAFQNTEIIVRVESNRKLKSVHNREFLDSQNHLEVDFMEEYSFSNADTLFMHSQGLTEFYSQVYSKKRNIFLLPYAENFLQEKPMKIQAFLTIVLNIRNIKGCIQCIDAISKLDSVKKITVSIHTSVLCETQVSDFVLEYAKSNGVSLTLCSSQKPSHLIQELLNKTTHSIILSDDSLSALACSVCSDAGIPALIESGIKTYKKTHNENIHYYYEKFFKEEVEELLSKQFLSRIAERDYTNTELTTFFHQELRLKNENENYLFEKYLVSVCIPVYKRDTYLRNALESLCAQTYSHLEVIICEEKVPDTPLHSVIENISQEYSDRLRIRYVCHTAIGPGGARNYAAAQAHGKYLLFLDDDNLLFPEAIEELVMLAERNSLDVVTASVLMFRYTKTGKEDFAQMFFLGNALRAGVLRNVFGDTFSLIKKSAFISVGGYDVNKLASHEDWELYIRLSGMGYAFEYYPDPLGWYHASSQGHFNSAIGHISQSQHISAYTTSVHEPIKDIVCFSQSLYNLLRWRNWFSVALDNASQDYLQRKFHASDKSLLRIAHSSQLEASDNCKILEVDSGIKVEGACDVAQVLLPDIGISFNKKYIFEFQITSICETELVLFYLNEHMDSYNQDCSKRVYISQGTSKAYIGFYTDSLKGRLLLHLSGKNAAYYIHRLELKDVSF